MKFVSHRQLCAIARDVFREGMSYDAWTEAIKTETARLGWSWKTGRVIGNAQRAVEVAHRFRFEEPR